MAAARELRERGLAERIPVTDAEVAEASAEPRESPPIDPDVWAQWKAEQAAEREAYRQAEAERWADRIPVTDAELEQARAKDAEREAEATAAAEADVPATERETIEPQSSAAWWQQYHAGLAEFSRHDRQAEAEKDGGPGVTPQRDADEANLAEVRAELERVGELVDRIPDRAAERRAEMDQAGIDEPVIHEPQAEPELEASWQPGDAQGQYEPAPDRTPSPRWRSASRARRRPRPPGKQRPGPSGTVRCNAAAIAPTASAAACSQPRRT